MKAQELRIGNYYNHNREIKQVTPSTIEEVWNEQREWCKPILLTEEWLLKMPEEYWDFVGYGTRLIYQDRLNPVIKIEQLQNNQWAFYFNDELISFKDYLHEAQNLYFALTGCELEIK